MLPSELIVVRYRENRAVPLELGAVPDNLELIEQLIEGLCCLNQRGVS